MRDETYEIHRAAFDGAPRSVEIEGEPWLLLGEVTRSLHMRRERALRLVGSRDLKQVDIVQNERAWPFPTWVISESGAMNLAATKGSAK